MNWKSIAELRSKVVVLFYQHTRQEAARVPIKALVVLALFLVAALLMALHSALTAKDASLHFKLQHGYHNVQVSVWVDGDLAYSGKVTGFAKKRFGLIPTDSVQGSLSEIIPVQSGPHKVRVRIEPEDAAMQEDSISGDFVRNSERNLSVSARPSRLSLSWLGTKIAPAESSSSFGWFSHYAGALILTIGGSIVSALTGYAIKELPARLRSASESAPEAEVGTR